MEININVEELRVLLQRQLISKMGKNPKFSIRSFANQLQIDPSSLSQILKGSRPLSKKMSLRLIKRMNIDSSELELIRQGSKELDRQRISDNNFYVMSDWYHFAILELINTKDFIPEEKWVAKRLGINISEVNIAVERLESLGYLKIDEFGNWVDDLGKAEAYADEFSSAAQKKLQKQILEMGKEAIDGIDYSKRVQSSMTLAVREEDIPKAKKRIREFLASLEKELQVNGTCDEVYHLSTCLYPVSRK